MGILRRLKTSWPARIAVACVALAAAIAVVVCLCTRGKALAPARGPLVGAKALEVVDSVEFWLNGEEVELKGLKGHPVLLFFWHPRDARGKSLAALPHVRDLADSCAGRGLVTIGLCVLDSPEEAEPILREHGVTFLTGLDCDADLHIDYRIDRMGTPYCYLIDPQGTVAWEGRPAHLTARRIQPYLP